MSLFFKLSINLHLTVTLNPTFLINLDNIQTNLSVICDLLLFVVIVFNEGEL